MIFNSAPFAVFIIVFFILYWFVFNRSLKLQNLLILAGSYIFYAWWDWRFLSLLMGSSALNYFLGIHMFKTSNDKRRKLLLYIGILQGLCGLIYFKYFNFFINSFVDAFSFFNINLGIHTLNIILPLGISFYTFRTMSYLLDINKGDIKPVSDWVVFFSYVSFFPSLISGPIDRAGMLIPQLEEKRIFNFERGADALRQILWGLFKKIVIADNCSGFVESIFAGYSNHTSSTLLFGAFLFSVQLYCDFSGYSDIAIGTGRLLGFDIMKNFNFPYFSKSITEFWRRWHISFSNWLRDYIYTPLTISTRYWGLSGILFSLIVTFVICGLWHGANWVYVIFGFFHGILLSIELFSKKKVNKMFSFLPKKLYFFICSTLTFFFWVFTLIFFRSENMHHAIGYLKGIFTGSLLSLPHPDTGFNPLTVSVIIPFFFIFEWLNRHKSHPLELNSGRLWIRWSYYFIIVFLIGMLGQTGDVPFIYFQF